MESYEMIYNSIPRESTSKVRLVGRVDPADLRKSKPSHGMPSIIWLYYLILFA